MQVRDFETDWPDRLRKTAAGLVLAALFAALFWLGVEEDRYLLFHVLAEMFRITVAVAIFLIAWNTRRYVQAGFVVIMGVGLLFVGFVDLLHTMAYKNMNIIPGVWGANVSTQLWMAGRFIEAPTFLLAMLIPRRKLNAPALLAGYGVVTALLLLSIFRWQNFPVCTSYAQSPTGDLTAFKVVGEWVVTAVLVASLGILLLRRTLFEKRVLFWLASAFVGLILSEIAFTLYGGYVFGTINQLGHVIKLFAFFCIYKALVETGLRRPYQVLFRDLRASRERLAKARDLLEHRVEERTAELRQAVDNLMVEVRDRLAAEKMLKESEERFRLIAETVQDVFWISTPGMTKILYVSPAYEKIWGRSCQSLYDDPGSFTDAVHPDDRNRMIAGTSHPIDGQWDFEYRIVRPDGTVCWVRDRGYPIRDEQGNLTGMAGAASDITARRMHEQDLAESEARLAKAQEIARMGNWEWDITSNELWWSDQIYRIFGVTPGEFPDTYEAFESFVHPDDRQAVESAVKESLADGKPYQVDHRIILRDGTERVVHESGEIVRDAAGKPIRMSGTVQDITRRKRIEAELLESEQRYRELVELSPIGIIVSVEDAIVFANPAAAAILGESQPKSLEGRNFTGLVHPDYAAVFKDRLRCAQEMRAEMPLVEMEMTKADGTPGRRGVGIGVRDAPADARRPDRLPRRDRAQTPGSHDRTRATEALRRAEHASRVCEPRRAGLCRSLRQPPIPGELRRPGESALLRGPVRPGQALRKLPAIQGVSRPRRDGIRVVHAGRSDLPDVGLSLRGHGRVPGGPDDRPGRHGSQGPGEDGDRRQRNRAAQHRAGPA